MAKDLTVMLEDRPGSLAGACEALGRAGINIDGSCAYRADGGDHLHVLVEDAAGARQALEGAGYQVVGERDVLVTDVEDRPGASAEIMRRIGDAGVNVDLFYMATKTRHVIGADDLDRARSAL
jgi:hypothetical protein